MTTPQAKLAEARSEVLAESVHAIAHLVLHVAGEQRLERAQKDYYLKVIRALIAAAEAPHAA